MCEKNSINIEKHHFLHFKNASTFILFPDLLHLQPVSLLAELGWGWGGGHGVNEVRGAWGQLRQWLQCSSAGPHSSSRWHPGLAALEHLPSLPSCDRGRWQISERPVALLIADDVGLVPGGHRSRVKKKANHPAITLVLSPSPAAWETKWKVQQMKYTLCPPFGKNQWSWVYSWWKSLNVKIVTSSWSLETITSFIFVLILEFSKYLSVNSALKALCIMGLLAVSSIFLIFESEGNNQLQYLLLRSSLPGPVLGKRHRKTVPRMIGAPVNSRRVASAKAGAARAPAATEPEEGLA